MESGNFKYFMGVDKADCGCKDKTVYTVFKKHANGTIEIMGKDEFTYTTQKEFNEKVQELAKRFNVDSEDISYDK